MWEFPKGIKVGQQKRKPRRRAFSLQMARNAGWGAGGMKIK